MNPLLDAHAQAIAPLGPNESSRASSARGLQAGPRRVSAASPSLDAQLELLKLVQQIFLPVGTTADGLRSVVFTTPAPSHEAEATSAGTAKLLAERTERTVCLVDANLREPFLHRRFGAQNATGLSDILAAAKPAAAVAVKVAPQLWLVPAGQRSNHSSPAPDDWRRGVASLLATFDFVLFAASSLGASSDGVPLATAVDGVVLLIETDATRQDAARRAVDTLREANARLLGVVVRDNRLRPTDGTSWWTGKVR